MAKEPTELRPKTVRPIRPRNVEKHELYAEVGRAIVLLSDIESWLVAIAYHVALPTSGMKVPDMFYAIFGFEKRLQFADVIVELEATDDEKKRWRKITSELKAHKGIRNFVAHYGSRATTRRSRAMWRTGATANPIRWLAQAAIGRVGRLSSTPMATRSAGAALASSALKASRNGLIGADSCPPPRPPTPDDCWQHPHQRRAHTHRVVSRSRLRSSLS